MAMCPIRVAVLAVCLGLASACGSEGAAAVDASNQNDASVSGDADTGATEVLPEVSAGDTRRGDEVSPELCDPARWGTMGIGSLELALVDDRREGRQLPTRVFYSTAEAGDLESCYQAFLDTNPLIRMTMPAICAVPGAPIDLEKGPYPLVVISHGDGGQKEGHTYEAEYLATHGFVVALLDHTGNCGPTQAGPEDLAMSYTRVVDVAFVLDEILAASLPGGQLESWVDPEKVAVAGHSWGGHTAAVMAGLEYNWSKIESDCQSGNAYDDWYCPPLEYKAEMQSLAPDTRVKALVTWAHDAGHIVAAPACQGASGVVVPWLQMVGTQDSYAFEQEDGWDCYEKSPGPACIVVMQGAGHLGFSGIGDERDFGAARMFDVVRVSTAAFLLSQFGGVQCSGVPDLSTVVSGEGLEVSCRVER